MCECFEFVNIVEIMRLQMMTYKYPVKKNIRFWIIFYFLHIVSHFDAKEGLIENDTLDMYMWIKIDNLTLSCG